MIIGRNSATRTLLTRSCLEFEAIMFTGIVAEMGVVKERTQVGSAIRFRIQAVQIALGLSLGDSVACNGVCLTAEAIHPDGFTASAVPETLSVTTLGDVRMGHTLNLEAALKAGSPMGGHIVQGHVDAVAEVLEIKDLAAGAGKELSIRIPQEFTRYCVVKGSIALHGVSLTIAGVDGNVLRFAIVPHTLANTSLGTVVSGQRLNIEVDLLGKYVEKLLGLAGREAASSLASGNRRLDTLTPSNLEKWGYGV